MTGHQERKLASIMTGSAYQRRREGGSDCDPSYPLVIRALCSEWGRAEIGCTPAHMQSSDAYDWRADMSASIDWAYRFIRERVAAGGKGWRDYRGTP